MSNELALRNEVSPVVKQANEMTVTNADQYAAGADFLKSVKSVKDKVTAYFEPMKSKAHATWKEICDQEKTLLDPLRLAEETAKRKLLSWKIEDDRRRAEEQRRLQAIAEEQARKERERLEKQAEKLKTPELREERMDQAANIIAPVVEVQSAVPDIKGISVRKTWKAQLTDKVEFVKAAVSDPTLMAMLIVDISALDKIAKATKGGVNYPGVRFYEEASMASSTRL